MNIIKAQNFTCPIDGELLSQKEKQLVCCNGHTFDIARQGYVNLLPVQHKRSKEPGDSKEMVLARTEFLNLGFYEPIAQKLTNIIKAKIAEYTENSICLFDAGCGEGYYFDYILKSLAIRPGKNKLTFIGLDISKHAIHEATKRNKQISWLVGTNRQPPVVDNSVDFITCIFGFQSFEGFSKILKSDGIVILVEPGPDHLKELRDIIYKEVKKTEPPNLSVAEKIGFSVFATEHLQFKTGEINNEIIKKLLLMTPHFFRADKAGREAASNIEKLDLSVDIVYRVLTKCKWM